MKDGNEQQKEIATIKPRTLQLKLSAADCERIAERAGACGLTVSELLENFIGDLVSGTYSNGSDERMYANNWFDRCWFGMFPEDTFLRHLIEWGDLENFLDSYEYMQDKKDNIEITTKEIETGIIGEINGKPYTWKDLVNSDNKPSYKSKEEWEAEEKADLESYKEQYEDAKKELLDCYEYYAKDKENKESFEKSLSKVLEYVKQLEAFKGVEE